MNKFLHGMVQRTCGRDITLDQQGIVSFNVNHTQHSQTLASEMRCRYDAANDAVFEIRREAA